MSNQVKCTHGFPEMGLSYRKLHDEIYKQAEPIDLVCFLSPPDPLSRGDNACDSMEPIPIMSE